MVGISCEPVGMESIRAWTASAVVGEERANAEISQSHGDVVDVSAQNQPANSSASKKDNQINVNWFYGSYVPKEVPLESLSADRRFKLYIRQTYTTWGIYIKTTLFTIHDQVHNTYPEWGEVSRDSLSGWEHGRPNSPFKTRLLRWAMDCLAGSRVTTVAVATGSGRAHDTPWSETLSPTTVRKKPAPSAISICRPFAGSVTATAWEPGNPRWEVKGYQAAITQVFVGMGINWIGEFAPEIGRVFHKPK